MKRLIHLIPVLALTLAILWGCGPEQRKPEGYAPQPTEGRDEQRDRQEYINRIHRAAPGVDWRQIEAANTARVFSARQLMGKRATGQLETFADGRLKGAWEERGPDNRAGDVRIVSYYPPTNQVYLVNTTGLLWRGNLDGTGWTVLNQNTRFSTRALQVLPRNGQNKRILTAIGKFIWYSDDEGATWAQSTGLSFYDGWGSPQRLIALNDAQHTLYYLVHTWIRSPWGSGFLLYKSTDLGATFRTVGTFTLTDGGRVDAWSPLGSSSLLVMDNKARMLYRPAGDTITPVRSYTDIDSAADFILTGTAATNPMELYAMVHPHATNRQVFISADSGATWAQTDSVPGQSLFDIGWSGNPFTGTGMYMGGVEVFKSATAGASWLKQSNWYAFYSDQNFLHADVVNIQPFRKADGTPFFIVCNHSGMHITYDNFASFTYLNPKGLNVCTYYDHITAPDDHIIAGAQDKGLQRGLDNTGTGMLSFEHMITGDYLQLQLSNGDKNFWTEYPYGSMTYWLVAGGWVASYSVKGDDKQLWAVPTAPVANPLEAGVFVGGGSITGDTGSYLLKLTPPTANGGTVTPFQYDFNFKANSVTGKATISAMSAPSADYNRLYVACSDGSFFYSNDRGSSWARTDSFTGPPHSFLYGTFILPSPRNPDILYYCGSGYSNPGVYVSKNGGVSFRPMADSLPKTLVYELALSPDETMLFAATASGPYVYMFGQKRWYSMLGQAAPVQEFRSVEYLKERNVVRFATYGRGIWDFAIQSAVSVNPVAAAPDPVSVYPNPVPGGGMLHLLRVPVDCQLIMATSDGRVVQRRDLPEGHATVNLSGMAAGTYMYTVRRRDATVVASGIMTVR